MSFGNRLRNLRLQNNMTQEDLSKRLNLSRATVGRYETNERFPDKNTLLQIADIFDVSTDYLLERTNNPNSYSNKEKSLDKTNNPYYEIEEKIIQRLILEELINIGEPIPKKLFENIIEYGIEAAIKIAKLEKYSKTEC